MAKEEYKSHAKEYYFIFGLLAFLTFLELFIPGMENASKVMKGALLTILAVAKAFLVAYFFMHLKEEKAWVKILAAVPLAAVLFAVVVILESMSR